MMFLTPLVWLNWYFLTNWMSLLLFLTLLYMVCFLNLQLLTLLWWNTTVFRFLMTHSSYSDVCINYKDFGYQIFRPTVSILFFDDLYRKLFQLTLISYPFLILAVEEKFIDIFGILYVIDSDTSSDYLWWKTFYWVCKLHPQIN